MPLDFGTSPPKPSLALRIGVTGHRPNRFPESAQQRAAVAVPQLFEAVKEAMARLHVREREFFADGPPEIRVVSALAEGADRLVARAALQAGFPLEVVLPFSPDAYVADFPEPESKSEFFELLARAHARMVLPGRRSTEGDGSLAEHAYESAGLMTLRQCDVLIAIWDGGEPWGRGGTQQIVQHAIASRIPVLMFDGNGDGPFLLFAGQSARAERVEVQQAERAPITAETIDWLVRTMMEPPSADAGSNSENDDRARRSLRRYLRESEQRVVWMPPLYPLLVSALSGFRNFGDAVWPSSKISRAAKEWATHWETMNGIDDSSRPRIAVVVRRFAWADEAAEYYGRLYRSGYVANFLLAALAVFAGAVGQTALEWLLTIAIVACTWSGTRGGWHERWCDYRQLSEQLRHLKWLALTGSSAPEARLPAPAEELEAGTHWTSWYYRTTVREVGLPNVVVDPAYVAAVNGLVRDGEVASQRTYHAANAVQMRRVAFWLEGIGLTAFLLVPPLIWMEGVPRLADWSAFHRWLVAVSIMLPALGAASFGIRVYGDFKTSAERSAKMEKRLSRIEAAMRRDVLTFSELSALVEESASVLSSEVRDWAFVYRAKPLALP